MTRATLLALLAAAVPGLAAAQDGSRLSFRLGAGISSVPEYFGSNESEVGPSFSVNEGFLSFGRFAFGDADPTDIETGLGFRGSFRYVSGREGDDFGADAGVSDVDATFEIGGGLSYVQPWYEAFAVARYGVGGSEALVGDLGVDLIARPTERLTLRAGPRLQYGSGQYAETYFSVESTPGPVGPVGGFDASGGLLSSGVEVGASYDLTDRWGLQATARYDRLQGDAEDSPITEKDDQVSATVEITRTFDFRF
jgi:outer membrane scaffolding protein for murein synthesis (MipA/OmpV family)